MVINVTATTTAGKQLSPLELKRVNDACDAALALDKARQKLLGYVETRMSFMAPNLTNILGSGIAAKLIGISGGLTNLSKIPSSNIMVFQLFTAGAWKNDEIEYGVIFSLYGETLRSGISM
jgi:U4/U6 small nuclear ribonucleoprotein PRP31